MKILMLNTFDELGGAARAAGRLLDAVRRQNIEANLLVQFKSSHDSRVICNNSPFRKAWRRLKILLGILPVLRYPLKPKNNFSPSVLGDGKLSEIAKIKPDIIHLHWVCAGFLQIETLAKLKTPLIWTLHDSWAFTGGCHVPFDCLNYRQSCGRCPVLGSSEENDLSHRTWTRKAAAWKDLNLTVVAPSRWLAESARASSLFRQTRIETIPYGLDTGIFRPLDQQASRNRLGLPPDKKIILFGAVQAFSDPNKGFHLLQSAMQIVGQHATDTMAVVFSSLENAELPELGMPSMFIGRVDEGLLPALYAACDVFVLPSKLENMPLTILEAMACGTPCVAFRQGGVPDEIDHEVSGYLAEPYVVEDLAEGIMWVIGDENRHKTLSLRARQKIENEFSRESEGRRYAELYRDISGRP